MEQVNDPREDISLRSLIMRFLEYWRHIWRYWYIPAVFAAAGMGYKLYKYYTYKPVYPATITFSVDEDEGGSSSGLTGILGQFGLGGVRPARYNLDKILALSKSRRVIQQTLFAKVTVDGKEDYLANHLIREYHLQDATDKAGSFHFTQDSIPAFSTKENEMLLQLYNFIIGPKDQPKKALMTADYNEDTNIMSIDVQTTHETISLQLAQRMFESLSAYYINKAIEKQLKTYTIVSEKRDSVLAALKAAEYQLANFRDSHRGLLMRTDQITELRLTREIASLSAMYSEVLKNTEVADFSLKNKTPFIQVIDTPISPIQPVLLSLLRSLVIGAVAGGMIGCAWVIGRKIVSDALLS